MFLRASADQLTPKEGKHSDRCCDQITRNADFSPLDMLALPEILHSSQLAKLNPVIVGGNRLRLLWDPQLCRRAGTRPSRGTKGRL